MMFENEHWMERSRCVTERLPWELFFPEPRESPAAAKAECAKCPTREECLDYALRAETGSSDMRIGIFGGRTAAQRALMRKPAVRKDAA